MIHRCYIYVLLMIQVAIQLADLTAKKQQADLHKRKGTMRLAFAAWYDWLGVHLAKIVAEHEQKIYLQVCQALWKIHLENSPSKMYPGKHTLTSLYTWQTCGAFHPVPRSRCLLHAKHIIHSTFVLLMPTCNFFALPDTFMQHHQTLPCTKLVHACIIIGSLTPHLDEYMASHLTNHFCKLCYAKPWGSLFILLNAQEPLQQLDV